MSPFAVTVDAATALAVVASLVGCGETSAMGGASGAAAAASSSDVDDDGSVSPARAFVGDGGAPASSPSPTSSASAGGSAPIGKPDASSATADASSVTDGRAPSTTILPTSSGSGATGCLPISLDSTTLVDSSSADTYSWYDSTCSRRTAALLRNDTTDAFGEAGGYARRMTYESGGTTRSCTGTGQNNWYGFGYVVLHYGDDLDINTETTLGTTTIVLEGRHHAIHQFAWQTSPGGPVAATAQWTFATGRDHPLYTITLDASAAGPNVVDADSRAPYGDLAWDGDANGDVDGVGWGDEYQFATTGGGPVTPTSAWTYTAPNQIPYAMEWSTSANAEMGLVATQPFATRIQGGDYGDGLLADLWGTTGTNLLTTVPESLWPFQLNQYELADETNSHRVAWGATFGAVGQTTYQAFGQTLSGYPRYSYSVFVVLGTHTASAVVGETSEMEAVAASSLTATRGTVSTSGPAGIARTDTVPYSPVGFDPVYAVWDATAANDAVTLALSVPSGALKAPIFRVHGYTSMNPPSSVTVNGLSLAADTGYFATVDTATHSLWLTLNLTATGTLTLAVDP